MGPGGRPMLRMPNLRAAATTAATTATPPPRVSTPQATPVPTPQPTPQPTPLPSPMPSPGRSPASNNSTRKEKSAKSKANASNIFFLPELDEAESVRRSGQLSLLARLNTRKCRAYPVYGADLREAVTIKCPTAPDYMYQNIEQRLESTKISHLNQFVFRYV